MTNEANGAHRREAQNKKDLDSTRRKAGSFFPRRCGTTVSVVGFAREAVHGRRRQKDEEHGR